MKHRGLTKQEKRYRAARLAVWLTIGPIIVIMVLGIIRASLPAPPQLDEATLCPIDGKPRGHVAILVDKTDFYAAQHVTGITHWIGRKRTSVPEQAMLSVRLITDSPEDAGRPLFSRCNPGDGRHLNRWLGNPRKALDRWLASFGKPLDDALEPILRAQETKVSPILEAIDVMMWDTTFGPDVPDRTLVIASDLVQNMPDHNHYRSVPRVDAFLETPLGKRLKSRSWQGVRVELIYLRNVKFSVKQAGTHIAFWETLFRKLGAAEVYAIPPFELDRGSIAAR